tara:strand:+ start:3548 stop:4903 length:1356 start_codon:yes stop_codon:yes gene_type:complete
MKNRIISITGASGVGKTTVANLFKCILKKSIIVSGDDSHKWNRESENWKNFTHLNPSANNLEKEKIQLRLLKKGKTISRKLYNHNTGKFDEPIEVSSTKNIIYEGLHTLYDKEFCDLSDLKIYVEAEHKLKVDWKTKRDIRKRGYTRDQVIHNISRRKNDEVKFIHPQKQNSDVIIYFIMVDDKIRLHYHLKSDKYSLLLEKLKKLYDLNLDFIDTCNDLAKDSELVQNIGGNVSVKFENKMLITSSGVNLSDVSISNGFCVVDFNKNQHMFPKNERPSMELNSHLALNNTAVIHTHPFSLLVLLCSKQGEQKINEIFKNFDFKFINYANPGKEIHQLISKNKNTSVIFLQNHGLFVSTDSLKKSFSLTKKINDLAKQFIASNSSPSEKTVHTDHCLFPDCAVLPEKNKHLNNLIFNKIHHLKMDANFLSYEKINELLQMEEEKYRKAGVK